jgi:cytochrome c oxidase subunit II
MLTLELAWTIIPLILVVIPFHYGFKVYVHNAVAAEGATEIRVRAEKWKWEFQYPNGMRENGLLRIPINKPVKFVISSEDVLHSFCVPAPVWRKTPSPAEAIWLAIATEDEYTIGV